MNSIGNGGNAASSTSGPGAMNGGFCTPTGRGNCHQPPPPALPQPSTSRNGTGDMESSNECFTMWEPLKLRQEWTITNFTKALELAYPGSCMRSRTFRDESMADICWQLCLYPGGKREENQGNVSLFLKMSTNAPLREFTVRAEYKFYFMDENGVPRFSNVNTGDFKVKPTKGSHSWGLRNIPKTKVMNCIRSDFSLHIVCEIELVPDFNKIQNNTNRRTLDQIKLDKEFLGRIHNMFQTGEGSDMIIECEEQQFNVHKFILMAHSDVFRAMFSHEHLLECQEGRIRLKDTNPIAVQQMLTYMYSGNLPEGFEDDHAPALIEIAEKYQLEPLKMILQDKLIQRLSQQNVCSMLVLADIHNAEMLMNACIPLVKTHIRQLLTSPEWAQMKDGHDKLTITILEKVATYDNTSPAPPAQKRIRLLDYFYRNN